MSLRTSLFVVLALLTAACGKSPDTAIAHPGPSVASQPAGRGEPASDRAPEAPASADFDGAATAQSAPAEAPAPAPSRIEESSGDFSPPRTGSGRAVDRSRRPIEDESEVAPRERPGLATLWGEDRDSHVEFVSFRRATSTPFSVARVFYNDEAGVRGMAARSAASDFGDGGRGENGLVSVRLLDEDGDPLPSFEVASRRYVVGEPGKRYSIQIQNHTGSRFEAVASVDGLDVIDGRDGSLGKRGYIVHPFSSVNIDGFRRSLDTVAAFRFGKVGDSYAARKGKARNVGLVGVALFHEVGSMLPTAAEIDRRHGADPFPGRFAQPAGR
jgi:hypothetical protein